MKNKYVCGFLFIGDSVLLVKKKKGPPCVVGLWNGIGGTIEPGETPLEAMIREFSEETGIGFWEWKHFCLLVGEKAEIYFFSLVTGQCAPVRSHNDIGEELGWANLVENPISNREVVPNLRWLIPLAADNVNAVVEDPSI